MSDWVVTMGKLKTRQYDHVINKILEKISDQEDKKNIEHDIKLLLKMVRMSSSLDVLKAIYHKPSLKDF